MPPTASYEWIVEQRRALRIEGYRTLAEVGFEGPWVTPYQKTSCSMDGPVLVALHWLDWPSIDANRTELNKRGYLRGIRFNNVLGRVLQKRCLAREDIYVTQAFHLIPRTRSERISPKAIDLSFDAVTRHELVGRHVIALGNDAASACRRHGVEHVPVCHPSRRGWSYEQCANEIANAFPRVETPSHACAN
jgi:hypothetical protein